MFIVTEAAKAELQNRLKDANNNQLIRLQMRKSCFMKLKLRLEESILPNDDEMIVDEMSFIIDKGECHYFRNKTLDFIPDKTGFKQFEII